MDRIIIAAIAFYLGYKYANMTPEQRQNLLTSAESQAQSFLPASTPTADYMKQGVAPYKM